LSIRHLIGVRKKKLEDRFCSTECVKQKRQTATSPKGSNSLPTFLNKERLET